MKEKLDKFAAKVTEETMEAHGRRFPDSKYDFTLDGTATVHIGKKYARVDVGRSGKYMVDLNTGQIFGIKAYGVPNKRHVYGTLDTINDWYWGEYKAFQKGRVANILLQGRHMP